MTNEHTATNKIRFIEVAPLIYRYGIDEIASNCRSLAISRDFGALKVLSGRFSNDLSFYYDAIAEGHSLFNPSFFFDLRMDDRYQPRVILTGGQCFLQNGGEISIARRLIDESQRRAVRQNDWLTVYQAATQTAIIASIEGDHRGALSGIRKMWPLVHHLSRRLPVLYYYFLNTIAVELSELGELDQARRLASVCIASPYVNAYPEWVETLKEILSITRPPTGLSVLISRSLAPRQNVIDLEPLLEARKATDLERGGKLLEFIATSQMPNPKKSAPDQQEQEQRKDLCKDIFDMILEDVPMEALEKAADILREGLEKRAPQKSKP